MATFYYVNVDQLGPDYKKGDHVAPEKFQGVDIERLLQSGAISPVEVNDAKELPSEIESVVGDHLHELSEDDLATIATAIGITNLPTTQAGLIAAIEQAQAAVAEAQSNGSVG